jgi:hypothetical protein
MERDYDQFELVHVIKPFRLIDSDSYERVYWRRDGVALAPGYYVASWPAHANQRRFNEEVAFRGPFRERIAAEEVLQQMATRNAHLHRASVAAAPAR